MRQYYITEAYTDNYHVVESVDGEISDTIVVHYELGGYIRALENKGYTRAYYLPYYGAKLREAKELYEQALKEYERAKENPLHVSKQEIMRNPVLREQTESF